VNLLQFKVLGHFFRNNRFGSPSFSMFNALFINPADLVTHGDSANFFFNPPPSIFPWTGLQTTGE
jgi:hypothetical protein